MWYYQRILTLVLKFYCAAQVSSISVLQMSLYAMHNKNTSMCLESPRCKKIKEGNERKKEDKKREN